MRWVILGLVAAWLLVFCTGCTTAQKAADVLGFDTFDQVLYQRVDDDVTIFLKRHGKKDAL